MFPFAAGPAELVITLLVFLGVLIKGIVEYLAEQKKKQKTKKNGVIVQGTQENENTVLAETAEIAYDLESLEILEVLDDVSVRTKKTPKIRSKFNRGKVAEQPLELASVSVPHSGLAAPVESEPPPSGTSRSQPSPLAVELFKMFQSPTGVQQAVLAGEILKKRF
ncbi:MAG: hypothetical protein FWC43_14325 [Planctomycetaceae bacterium]|nr:hypothetical protein [Planctomycetaceae bacterium]